MNPFCLLVISFFNFCGTVKDAESGMPVENVIIRTVSGQEVVTDAEGKFCIALSDSTTSISLDKKGYEHIVFLPSSNGNNILLNKEMRSLEEIVIRNVRPAASQSIPLTAFTLQQSDIERNYAGQEVPVVLSQTPSITWYSDGGGYSGYSYMRLRGMDQTRINFTLNGVPLNEPEDQGVYFSNYPDFMNSMRSVQIQRGVGTSTNGTSSYIGSVNFESPELTDSLSTELNLSYGSYNTYRISPEFNTGLIQSKFAFYGRYSLTGSDGFRDHSGTQGQSFFFSGGYFAKRSVLRLTTFTGASKNGMAYLAESSADLDHYYRKNSMLEDETDEFHQSLAMLQYIRAVKKRSYLTATIYYNRLNGNYNIYFAPDMMNFAVSSEFVGAIINYTYQHKGFNLSAGAHANTYLRDHYLSQQPFFNNPFYKNTGHKQEASAFVKASCRIGRMLVYGDLQYRYVHFSYTPDDNIQLPFTPVSWNFINPKAGASFKAGKYYTLYTSIGKSNREPTRNDMFAGFDNIEPANYALLSDFKTVKPEEVIDLEIGVKHQATKIKMDANVYMMWFHNEIAAIGQLSYIGLPLRKNVEHSYRRGVELSLIYSPVKKLTAATHANFSHNRIEAYTNDADLISYKNVQPLLTPQIIFNQSVRYEFIKAFTVEASGRYSSSSFLDNTNNKDYITPSSLIFSGSVYVLLAKNYTLGFIVNNIFNTKYYTSGYVQSAQSYYYPMATRNYFITVKMKF